MIRNAKPFAPGDGRFEDRSKGGRTSNARQRARKMGAVRIVAAADLPGALETLDDAVRWAAWAAEAIATGKLDRATGREVGSVLRVFVDGRQRLDRVDERVRRLQEQIAALRKNVERG